MVISLLVCWIIGVGMLSKYIFVNEKLREIIILIVKLYKLKEIYIVYTGEHFCNILLKEFSCVIDTEYEELLNELLDDKDELFDLLNEFIRREEIERIYKIEGIWVRGWMLFGEEIMKNFKIGDKFNNKLSNKFINNKRYDVV